ncbi:MAG: Pleiotropic regulatory protein DegT, partial [Parcubacteria group bacterium GW2011_GWF2_44_8b]
MINQFLNLKILLAFWTVIRQKDFILGREVQEIETKLAKFCGAEYAFGVGSGTDALILSLKACDIEPGDEVVTPTVGFFSSASAIAWVNA